MLHSLAKSMYNTYTGCPVTLCRHFWIKFLASSRLKTLHQYGSYPRPLLTSGAVNSEICACR
jgi:hypothetical protein